MLQVAAATNCKHHYGVEKADIPAKYAEVSGQGPWTASAPLPRREGGRGAGGCWDGEREGRPGGVCGGSLAWRARAGPAWCVSVSRRCGLVAPRAGRPASLPGQRPPGAGVSGLWAVDASEQRLVPWSMLSFWVRCWWPWVSWTSERFSAPQCAPWGPRILPGWMHTGLCGEGGRGEPQVATRVRGVASTASPLTGCPILPLADHGPRVQEVDEMVRKKACRIHSECHRSAPRGYRVPALPPPDPPSLSSRDPGSSPPGLG